MGEPPRVTAIVVNYRTPNLTLTCLASLAQARKSFPSLDVCIVDGGSEDESAEILRRGIAQPSYETWVDLLPLARNGGFGYANNQALLRIAARPSPPDYVLLLNPDAKLLPGAAQALATALDERPKAGAAGARLQGANGRPQGSAFSFPTIRGELSRGTQTDVVRRLTKTPPVVFAPDHAMRVPWVTGPR